MNKLEFIGFTHNKQRVLCKTSEQTVDVLDAATLQLVCKLDTDQPKCFCATERYVLLGCWSARVMVYDQSMLFLKTLKVKASIRAMCQFGTGNVLVGQNDGIVDVVRVAENPAQIDV